MSFEKILKIGFSGLNANRTWMATVASNLANINTTRTDEGQPYRRRVVIFESSPVEESFEATLKRQEELLDKVRVVDIVPDGRDFKEIYDPSHPDADKDGIVKYPNINHIEEVANLLEASRAYEANLTVIDTTKQMVLRALELGR
ncbi:MAG: flagellar basal body rod protein FlgC [Syntrophobacterales bacterium]|nr:flagellar basal body rod protein FlgC [Syntrophobacterales bacterium]